MRQTEEIRRYEELKALVETEGFALRKRELRRFRWRARPDGQTWKNSSERMQWLDYRQLKKNAAVQRYGALTKDPFFNACREWKAVFEDRFTGMALDESKWMSRYYAGGLLLKDTYGVGNDRQLFRPANVGLKEGQLWLECRKEAVRGKFWDMRLGVVAKAYDYTSAIAHTGHAFRQRYGRFEAKIRVDRSPVGQYFWLSADGTKAHINIMKFDADGYEASYYLEQRQKQVVCSGPAVRLVPGWYIFTFDWSPGQWIWKINDCVVGQVRGEVADAVPALYAGFSLRVEKEVPEKDLPVVMPVEWIRFYVMNNIN